MKRILLMLALALVITTPIRQSWADIQVQGYLKNAALENLTADPIGPGAIEGRIYWDNVNNKFRIYDGAAWTHILVDIVDDTTPQLGGDLELNGSDILAEASGSTTMVPFIRDPKAANNNVWIVHDGSATAPATGTNTFIGSQVGVNYGSAAEGNGGNTCIGWRACRLLDPDGGDGPGGTLGVQRQVAVGVLALAAGEADQSVAIGTNAGIQATSYGQVFVGDSSGDQTQGGSQNTFVGSFSGRTNVSGQGNVLIGGRADTSASNQNYSIALGYDAVSDASNKMRIGSSLNSFVATTAVELSHFNTTIQLDEDSVNDGNKAGSLTIKASDKNGATSTGDGGDIILTPGTTTGGSDGVVKIDDATWPATNGAVGSFLRNDGSGNLSWVTTTVSDPLQLSDGLVSAPTYSFTSDPTTGFYKTGSALAASYAGGLKAHWSTNTNRSYVEHQFADGTISDPSITFGNATGAGLYRSGTGSLGLTAGGAGFIVGTSANLSQRELWLQSGTQTAPGLAFDGDTNLGLWRAGTDDLRIVSGNAWRVAVTNTTTYNTNKITANQSSGAHAIGWTVLTGVGNCDTAGTNNIFNGGNVISVTGMYALNSAGQQWRPVTTTGYVGTGSIAIGDCAVGLTGTATTGPTVLTLYRPGGGATDVKYRLIVHYN